MLLIVIQCNITNWKTHSTFNAALPYKANISLQHTAVRLPLFLFEVSRFFWIFTFISPSGSRQQLKRVKQNRVFSDELQKHDYLRLIWRTDRVAFILLRCQKKDSPYSSLSPLLRSTSVPRWQAHFKPLGATCLILSTHIWRAKSLSMVRFHFENNGNFITTLPTATLLSRGWCCKGRRNAREKRYLQGNPFTCRKWDINWKYLPLLP